MHRWPLEHVARQASIVDHVTFRSHWEEEKIMYRVSKCLFIVASMAALSSFVSVGGALAQGEEESLTAVCVTAFEAPVHVR